MAKSGFPKSAFWFVCGFDLQNSFFIAGVSIYGVTLGFGKNQSWL